MCILRLPCVFFFQAEDGIRDVAVTGVQTCALPICAVSWAFDQPIETVAVEGRFQRVAPVDVERVVKEKVHGAGLLSVDLAAVRRRSEERRVGKECRSRWSPYH